MSTFKPKYHSLPSKKWVSFGLRSASTKSQSDTFSLQRDLLALNKEFEATERAIEHAREAIKDMQHLESFEELERLGGKLKELLNT